MTETTLHDVLLDLERQLVEGDGDVYRSLLTENALVVLPGMRLDREECAVAIDAAPGWDEAAFDDVVAMPLTSESAIITYIFHGRRGEDRYDAYMSSVYVRDGSRLRLALHQQTPLP